MGSSVAWEAAHPPEVAFVHLHADWREAWCPELKSRANRDAIAANPRLTCRPAADLADRQGMQPLSRVGGAHPEDLAVYRAAVQMPARFRRVLGLAVLAPRLALAIDPKTIVLIRQQCHEADLHAAFQACRDIPDGESVSFDLHRIGMVADAAGLSLLLAWLEFAPAALAGRIRLTLSKAEGRMAAEDVVPEHLALLGAVARQLLTEQDGGAHDARAA